MDREQVERAPDASGRKPVQRRRQPAPVPAPRIGSIFALQRAAGNRAVAGLYLPVVQRTELATSSGGIVASTDGPGRNARAEVLGVQERLHKLASMDAGAYDSERALVTGKTDADGTKAADIPRTLEAIDRNEKPNLPAAAAMGVLKAALVAEVGAGGHNDGADVALILELLHEEWYISNKEYDDARTVLSGFGTAVDPATVPGFLTGLTRLKHFYAAGYPFRGSTGSRIKPVVPNGPEQAAYAKAVEHHVAERQQMLAWLQEAAAQHKDVLLRNSAQWLLSGRTKVYALTRTHDSPARTKAANHPELVALFAYPGGELMTGPSMYIRKAKGQAGFDNVDVVLKPSDEGGFQTRDVIGVVEPSRGGKDDFFRTVRHEAQHAADHHGPGDENLYRTELNARWVDGAFAKFSTTKKVSAEGFTWNERQYEVFKDLWSHPALYPYLPKRWYSKDPAERKAWRAMVVGYRKPDTFNPVNSVRIENLHTAIAAMTWESCRADDRNVAARQNRDPKALALWAALMQLDDADREAMKGNMTLNALALSNLSGRAHKEYFEHR